MNVPVRYYEIADSTHAIINPISFEKLNYLAQACRINEGDSLLDLACGRGELLCRWAKDHGIEGLGIDLHSGLLTEARARAADLGVAGRVQFRQGDAAAVEDYDRQFDFVSCWGAAYIGGGTIGTISLMQRALRDSGLLLLGEAYWIKDPSPEQIRARGCDPDEYSTLGGLLGRFAEANVELVEMVLSNQDDWDRYHAARWRNIKQWIDDNPQGPDAAGLRAYLDATRASYLTHLRESLGWGVFVLQPK